MGMRDIDELGNVTEYVYAGALAFEDTVQMRNLVQMRLVRPLQLRRAITVNRQQNAQACIAYLCGTVEPKPCGPCSRGSGPFQECVTVEGSLLGACASCHYGGEGGRCTFHSKSYVSDQYSAANIRKESQKEKGSRQAITVEDSDDASHPPRPKKRKYLLTYIPGGSRAVTAEQSGSSTAPAPRNTRKDTEESDIEEDGTSRTVTPSCCVRSISEVHCAIDDFGPKVMGEVSTQSHCSCPFNDHTP